MPVNNKLKILAPTRYPWRFNSPRHSRHDISIRNFIPFNKISPKIEGITVFNPFPLKRFDLIHAFNRIPLGNTPFIIGFESHLPRAFGLEQTRYFRWLSQMLASPRCKAIVAISEHAKQHFIKQHKEQPWFENLINKLHVRYPNMDLPISEDSYECSPEQPLRLLFVGSHFGRKGGPVAVRMAELAHDYGLRLEVHIVSNLEVGPASWVDPLQPGCFEPYLGKLKSLGNIRHHGSLPNREVLSLLKQAHFSLLPTFSDTFGFSAIESMANHVPVIATTQGALPEFINEQNGILLDLPVDEAGEWLGRSASDRNSDSYRNLYNAEIERLAHEALARLKQQTQSPQGYASMRKAAYATTAGMFDAKEANTYWDEFYVKALS